MLLRLVRILFILMTGGLGGLIARTSGAQPLDGILIGTALGLVAVGLELGVARRYASIIPTLVLGVGIGFVAAQLSEPVVLRLPWFRELDPNAAGLVSFLLILVFSYLAVALIAQTKDEFKFSIPYVQFRREGRGSRPLVVDTSAFIDGRFIALAESQMMDAPIVVPRSVILELQAVADAAEKIRRARGRRGLEGLQRLQAHPHLEIRLDETPQGGDAVDLHLVKLAKRLDARLVTTDFNLQKVAQVEGVDVVNLNALASLMRPALLAGEQIALALIRPGDEAGQAVGFLEDGTMVVVEGARDRIGQTVSVTVTNTLQTSAGRLVFAKPAQT